MFFSFHAMTLTRIMYSSGLRLTVLFVSVKVLTVAMQISISLPHFRSVTLVLIFVACVSLCVKCKLVTLLPG